MWLVFHDEGTSLHSLMYSAKAPSASARKEQGAAAAQQATAANQATTAADRNTTAAGWQALGMQSGAKQQEAKHVRPKDNDVEKSRQASQGQAEDSQVLGLAFVISHPAAKMLLLDFAEVCEQWDKV